jgi:hypothetical protein
MRSSRSLLSFGTALLVSAALAGCASAPLRCDPPARAQVQDLLYFGTRTPAGEVSPAQWAAFLEDTVTPRFPAGLTVWTAQGQWRDDAGAAVREASYVLNLVHPPGAAAEQAIADIIAAYRQRFDQQSVLRVRSLACVSG